MDGIQHEILNHVTTMVFSMEMLNMGDGFQTMWSFALESGKHLGLEGFRV
jgi:hypothetical protein